MDQRYEDAAATPRGGPVAVFRRVTLPLIGPSLAAGAVLAWARALGEFGATITFAGNIAGRDPDRAAGDLPRLSIGEPDAAIVLSLVLSAVSLVVLVSLRDRWLDALEPHCRGRRLASARSTSPSTSATAGETVAVLGPNGAGKTTLLRALAGLVALDAGPSRLDGTVARRPRRALFVPPERRPIGVVFQDYLLFPHLTAVDNVAFGLRARGSGAPRPEPGR